MTKKKQTKKHYIPVLQDIMQQEERAAYKAFWEKHRNCVFPSCIGGKISVEVTGTGLGYCFICKCNACGAEEDITFTDNW